MAASGDAAVDEGQGGPTAPDDGAALPRVVIDATRDLWQNITLNVREGPPGQSESNVFVVGAPGAGKSAVLRRLAAHTAGGGPQRTRPTTALDYSFARHTDRHATQVAHLWELAQGTELSQLCDVVITPENVHAMLLTIVVDCGDPSTMWDTTTYWMKRVDRRVMEISEKMRAKGSSTPDKLLTRAKRLLGTDHPDLDRLRLSGVPTVIICNKLDAFAGDMTALKTLVRCMRFIAHIYGAYLIFTSESDAMKLRLLMNHVIFMTPFDSRHIELDPERGNVLVIPSADTFADIGDPVVCDMGNFQSTGDAELDRWKAPLDAMYPPKQTKNRMQSDSFLKRLYDTGENGFAEPTVDAVHKQKEEELEQYRRTAFRREKSGRDDRSKSKEKKAKERE